jgi:hypothetical protein
MREHDEVSRYNVPVLATILFVSVTSICPSVNFVVFVHCNYYSIVHKILTQLRLRVYLNIACTLLSTACACLRMVSMRDLIISSFALARRFSAF